VAEVNYKELKKGGFMPQVQKDCFSLRLRVAGGNIQANQLLKVTEIADNFGQGYVHMTSRQGIEIPFIKFADVEIVKRELDEVGLQTGACGPRVRTITACQGVNVCPSGLIDTTSLAKELDNRYFAKELPHKFKIGVTGCKNNCLKAEENDLGIKGGVRPIWHKDECNFCRLCEAVCPIQAIKVQKNNQVVTLDKEKCNYCGKCVKACPVQSWDGESGFIISVGGLFGNRIAIGKQVFSFISSKEQLFKVIDKTLEFFQKYGKKSERFRNTLDRVGWEIFEKELEVRNIE